MCSGCNEQFSHRLSVPLSERRHLHERAMCVQVGICRNRLCKTSVGGRGKEKRREERERGMQNKREKERKRKEEKNIEGGEIDEKTEKSIGGEMK